MAKTPKTDVVVTGIGGSVLLLHLQTDAAREWVDAHVSDEAMFFGKALCVEPRYLENLVDGMRGDGLLVE